MDQELYNSFHFWRTPLPEIDLDVELQQGSGSEPGPQGLDVEPEVPAPGSASITMATRKELEEMIENLEPHIDGFIWQNLGRKFALVTGLVILMLTHS